MVGKESRRRFWIFPCSDMLSIMFNAHFGESTVFMAHKFSSPSSLSLVFNGRLYQINSRCRFPKEHESFPHFRLLCRRDGHPLSSRLRTRISDLQFSLVISNYNQSLGQAVLRLCANLFIHLFIQFQFSVSHSITLYLVAIPELKSSVFLTI